MFSNTRQQQPPPLPQLRPVGKTTKLERAGPQGPRRSGANQDPPPPSPASSKISPSNQPLTLQNGGPRSRPCRAPQKCEWFQHPPESHIRGSAVRPGGGSRAAGPGIASPTGPRREPDPDGPGPRGSQPAVASRASLAQPKLPPLASGTPRPRFGIPGSEPARAPAPLTCLRAAHLGAAGQAEEEAQHLQSPARPHDCGGGCGAPAQAGREGRWTRASKRGT